jgi:hypothetical protein
MSDTQQRLDDLRRRIDAGEPGLLDEYELLLASQFHGDQPPPDDDAIFDRLRVKKRPYTMSAAALEARRTNAQLSTGPVTPEGKAASSMNAWKHGLHARKRILSLGKPCRTTCPQYPCSLVDDGATQPGANCLDKEYMLHTVNALSKALADGDLTDLKQVITLQLGGTLQVIDELQASILEYGVYMKSEKIGKSGEITGYEIKPNPSLLPLSNLLKAAGVTMPDFMITPAAVEKQKDDKEAAATLADIFRSAGNALNQAKKGKAAE